MIDIRIQFTDFDIEEEWSALRKRITSKGGAIAAFAGLVRDSDDGDITGLYLEHYPGMTEKSIGTIVDQATKRWKLLDVVIIHRVGELKPSDQIVLVLVASPHRADAFAACEFLMDYLKTEAILWKKERCRSNDRWVESSVEDRQRAQDWRTETG